MSELTITVVASVITGFIAMQLTYALLAWALWTWLAMIIALLVSCGVTYVYSHKVAAIMTHGIADAKKLFARFAK